MLCDSAGSPSEEADRTTYDKETEPRKHPAVEGEGDVAFVCNICHMVTCKNCVEVTPTDSTPVSPSFPFTEGTNLPTASKDANSLLTSNSKENTNNSKESTNPTLSKSSLLDDFADPSAELPDYTGNDD
jgi:hypothetical protein